MANMNWRRLGAFALHLVISSAVVFVTACSDDDTPATLPDARGNIDAKANPPMDGDVLTQTFTVHYHRADGNYTGWNVVATAGAGAATAGTPDGFGAVYTLTLAQSTASVAFSLKNGDTSDDAGALTVDTSGPTREVWVLSGWAEAITRKLPALPSANQIAVYYLRSDTAYENWGLHLWGDQVANTEWTSPVTQKGVDPEFGAGFLIDKAPGSPPTNCTPGNICIIVHNGDSKDPGPDMTFTPATTGNIVFIKTGSTDITTVPRLVTLQITGIAAHIIDHETVAWCLLRAGGSCVGDRSLTQAELRVSDTLAVTIQDKDVVGGTVIHLTPNPAGLSAAQRAIAPYYADSSIFTIAEADQALLAEAVKGQMVAVARKDDGTVGTATNAEAALYLDEQDFYDGPLGATFVDGGAPNFRLWAPTARSVKLHVFDGAKAEITGSPFTMTRSDLGVWMVSGLAGWKNFYYRYEVNVFHPSTGKVETTTVTDPYSWNVATNGQYTQIVDLDDAALKPAGWDALVKPALAAPNDIVLYESHVRDFSVSDATVAAERRGKYLGFVTESADEPSNGMKHLAALATAGLTHIHLMPAFDFATIDEDPANRVDLDDPFSKLCSKNSAVPAALCSQFPTQTIRQAMATFPGDSDQQQAIAGYLAGLDSFNWGYDPFHYGAPEGSYASTADGTAKILEFRRMVQGLNAIGLRVVLDVVYNHTNSAGLDDKSVLDKIVPLYYHRTDPESGFIYNSSCCANTASEHKMMERLIVDTTVEWARAYKLDGFRFDLMGLHTKANMQKVQTALAALTLAADGVDGSKMYLYGEGWQLGEMANNARGANASQLNMAGTGIGTFNDRLRDGVRGGGPFDSGGSLRSNQGFMSGLYTDPNESSAANDTTKAALATAGDLIKIGMAGNLQKFRLVTATGPARAASDIAYGGQSGLAGYTRLPQESINYSAAHDNQDLWDIIQYKMAAGTTVADRARAQNLSLDVVLLGEGIPFIHMGDDILRSKSMDGNSYDSGDWFNLVDWSMQVTAFMTGLPRATESGNWDTIKKVFMDATAKPTPTAMVAAAAHFQELLKIRKSSPLFRLHTEADVLTRVDFQNGGTTQVPGVIVMTITDNVCAGATDLDPDRDGLVVVVNADKIAHTMSVAGADGATLHAIQQASADSVVRTASVSGHDLTVPARTTAVFEIPQSGGRTSGPACNTH